AGYFRPGQDLWAPLPWVAAGLAVLLMHALFAALLTQMTVVELSQFRPASRSEARAGLARHARRLLLAELVPGGLLLLLVLGLRWLEGRLLETDGPASADAVIGAVAAVRVVLEVLLWPVLALSLLLAPIVIVEECSVSRALAQWAALVRTQLG